MCAKRLYEKLLESVKDSLAGQGFKGSRSKFTLVKNNNIGLIEFQKSMVSSSRAIKFTINVGVCIDSLNRFDEGVTEAKGLTIDACHWKARAGYFKAEQKDIWWLVDESTNIDELQDELNKLLTMVIIPQLISRLSTNLIFEEWLSGVSPGLTEIQRLRFLSIMLSAKGDFAKLMDVVAEMRAKSKGKPFAGMIEAHLKRLECTEAR